MRTGSRTAQGAGHLSASFPLCSVSPAVRGTLQVIAARDSFCGSGRGRCLKSRRHVHFCILGCSLFSFLKHQRQADKQPVLSSAKTIYYSTCNIIEYLPRSCINALQALYQLIITTALLSRYNYLSPFYR